MQRFPVICYFDVSTVRAIRELQNKLFEITDSRACLDLWEPHLTIGDGIEVEDKKESACLSELQDVAATQSPFFITLTGFDFIDNWSSGKLAGYQPYVIFLKVQKTSELLRLVDAVKTVTDKHTRYYQQSMPYNPHITIAFKDLDNDGYLKAKNYLALQTFSLTTKIDHIAVSKESDNGQWLEYKRFRLG